MVSGRAGRGALSQKDDVKRKRGYLKGINGKKKKGKETAVECALFLPKRCCPGTDSMVFLGGRGSSLEVEE